MSQANQRRVVAETVRLGRVLAVSKGKQSVLRMCWGFTGSTVLESSRLNGR